MIAHMQGATVRGSLGTLCVLCDSFVSRRRSLRGTEPALLIPKVHMRRPTLLSIIRGKGGWLGGAAGLQNGFR